MKKRAVIHEKGIGDMSLGSDDSFAPPDADDQQGSHNCYNHQMSTILELQSFLYLDPYISLPTFQKFRGKSLYLHLIIFNMWPSLKAN